VRRSAGLLAGLLRAEGAGGLRARALDHLAASIRRRRFASAPLSELPRVPVLRVTAAPPVPWLGGVPAQLGALMHQQERRRDTALLYPWGDGLRLEVVAGGQRRAAQLGGMLAGDPADAAGWAEGIERAAAAVGARLLHVEGAAGLPHGALAGLARGRSLVLSLHDFALFCPRPNLYDERLRAPCGRCATAAACHATLVAAGRPDAEAAWNWRARGAELLASARCVVYPSEFLRAAHEELFGSAGAVQRVIPPGIEHARLEPWRWPWRGDRPGGRVAFVGGGGLHKGGGQLAAVIAEWTRRGLPALEWEVLGGGGVDQLLALRRLPGVRVRGYYRHGSLGRLLRAREVGLALLLPQVPESFSLSASECLAAGIPVMAPAQGALADRLRQGGYLLPAGADTPTVVDALDRWRRGELDLPAPPPPMPTTGGAVAGYSSLFDELSPPDDDAGPRFHFAPRRGDALRDALAGGERVVGAAQRWVRGELGLGEMRSLRRARRGPARRTPAEAPAGAPIVYLPALAWDYRFQRPQQLARAFVGAGHPVLYIEGFQRTRVMPRRSLATNEAGVDVLRLAVPGRPDPYREPLTTGVAEQLAQTVADGVRDRPLMVLAQLPFWMPLATRLRELLGVALVYDRLDFHLGFPGVTPEVDLVESELMAAADLVVASSPVLLEHPPGGGARWELVPNAVELSDFPQVPRSLEGPVTVGYVGALGPWFDAAAIEELARVRPGWTVRLAGRVESPAVRALARQPNVELLGEIPYGEVPAFLASLRALLIPFLDLPLTRAVDPVKLYEGLAAGLPVVSCRLPAVEVWSEPFVYSYDPGGLVAAIERALAADGPEPVTRRRHAVEGETWTARAEAILRLVGG
jgi:glycosyltransferase involved in cell wall biosynthesis